MNNRQDRINDFKKFYDDSKSLFNSFAIKDKHHKRLESLFSFYVSPGGRILQYDDKLVEVFYGKRPIGVKQELADNLEIKEKAEIAGGVTLQYVRTDDAHVACYLYPAKSENQRPIEDLIVLDYVKNPNSLNAKAKNHFKLFVAYMDSTCIDGELSLIQSLRVFYLKNFKKYIVDGVLQEQRAKKYLSDLSKYILTIGFSGFMILLITFYMDDIKNKDEEMARESISRDIESIKHTTEEISSNLKSLDSGAKLLSELSADMTQELNNFLDGNKLAQEKIDKSIRELNGSIQGLEKAYNNSLQLTPKSGVPEL